MNQGGIDGLHAMETDRASIKIRISSIGSKLMEMVIISSEKHGIWTLYSSVFPENTATLKLHSKFGFRIIGTRENIAQLDNQWRNTVLLERRSKKIGIEDNPGKKLIENNNIKNKHI